MPTLEEVLKQTGLTDEQIAALDPKIKTGVSQLVSTATQTLEAAELATRAQAQQYDTEIAPALNDWANQKAAYDAKMAAYDAALKSAKESGFVVPEILNPPAAARNADGKFVAGANAVPGSPQLVVADLEKKAGAAIGSMLDLTWKYQTLYGKPMPDSPTTLISEANAQRLDPISYAAKKYGFADKEAQIVKEAREKEVAAAVKEAVEKNTKEMTEKYGSNPMVRQATSSQFSDVQKAVKAGTRPDTMTMTPEQRRQVTRQQIHKDIADHETVQ